MSTYRTPGIYREDIFPIPTAELRTGVPAFLGFTGKAPEDAKGNDQFNQPQALTLWAQFETHCGPLLEDSRSYLAESVRGFFENGGSLCYVVLNDTVLSKEAVRRGLEALASLDAVDLICAPDIMTDPAQAPALQQEVLAYCEQAGDCFAILDSLPDASVYGVLEQRQKLRGTNGAVYFPWIDVGERDFDGEVIYVPACGHVAGVYARTDRSIGVHKAPANEDLEGVLDLQTNLTNAQQGALNPKGVNCLRAFPGRGIRVWGARTLSEDPAWTYINVRRLFLTAGRWIERDISDAVFEPNDSQLWARIVRELTAYFNDLLRRGALKGRTAQEAFYVKCDGETNPPGEREMGMVITEIGLAPTIPNEFVVVRITHGASGVTIVGPTRPE